MDSVNLLPHLSGDSPGRPHEVLFWRMQSKTALRLGDWKIVRNSARGNSASTFELYDLSNDLSETRDLTKQNPDKLAQLARAWEKLNGQMIAPVWTRP
jgi:arylsulfatase A-like enzyme